MDHKDLRVLELKVKNFCGIKVVDITPGKGVVVVGGDNEQGKTCVLNAIETGIRGKKFQPDNPIRLGETTADIDIKLGNDAGEQLRVIRHFTEGKGSTIKVKQGNANWTKPQGMLDGFTAGISFDPFGFTKMDKTAQTETLATLAGLDLRKIDAAIDSKFKARAQAAVSVKAADGSVKSMPRHADAPDEPVDVTALLAKIDEARVHNEHHRELDEALTAVTAEFNQHNAAVARYETDVAAAARALAILKEEQQGLIGKTDEIKARGRDARDALATHHTADDSQWRTAMEHASEINVKVAANAARLEAGKGLEALADEETQLTRDLQALRGDRETMIVEAKLPVDGLSFDETQGVTLNGVPFTQISTSEQIRASVRIGIACSPELKVMLVRDASLLDKKSYADLCKIAEETGHQIWLERVGDADEGAIVIEAGEVAGAGGSEESAA